MDETNDNFNMARARWQHQTHKTTTQIYLQKILRKTSHESHRTTISNHQIYPNALRSQKTKLGHETYPPPPKKKGLMQTSHCCLKLTLHGAHRPDNQSIQVHFQEHIGTTSDPAKVQSLFLALIYSSTAARCAPLPPERYVKMHALCCSNKPQTHQLLLASRSGS